MLWFCVAVFNVATFGARSGRLQAHLQDLSEMHRATRGTVRDLLATAEAVGDDQRITIGGAHAG